MTDPYTGYVKFGARDYDPTTQRWLQQDPTGLQAGPNAYEFVGDGPTNGTDRVGNIGTHRIARSRTIGKKSYQDASLPFSISSFYLNHQMNYVLYMSSLYSDKAKKLHTRFDNDKELTAKIQKAIYNWGLNIEVGGIIPETETVSNEM